MTLTVNLMKNLAMDILRVDVISRAMLQCSIGGARDRMLLEGAASRSAPAGPARPIPALSFACALVIAGFAGALTATPSAAADFSDPDWPCIQRKVPQLSVGQMWAGPLIDETLLQNWDEDEDATALAPALAARRTAMAEAETLIASYATDAGAERTARLTALFAGVFSRQST